MSDDKDALTFSSVGPSGMIIHYTRCWACQTMQCPGGWHGWADSTDVEHALNTGQADPSGQKCGCRCADGPVLDVEPDTDDHDSLWENPCPICDATGECGRDDLDRPWIHTYDPDDDEFEPPVTNTPTGGLL